MRPHRARGGMSSTVLTLAQLLTAWADLCPSTYLNCDGTEHDQSSEREPCRLCCWPWPLTQNPALWSGLSRGRALLGAWNGCDGWSVSAADRTIGRGDAGGDQAVGSGWGVRIMWGRRWCGRVWRGNEARGGERGGECETWVSYGGV
jgi:hypothetical protein